MYVGDPLRYRVAMPWGEQAHVFSMEGHRWRAEPNMIDSEQFSSKSLMPGETIDAYIVGGAGSGMATGGDYLYLDHRQPFLEAGLWGMMRTYDTMQPDLLALPGNGPPPTATNTPLPTATNTPLPTVTNTPWPTATNTPLPTATNTAVPTPTHTPTPLPPTDTATPLPTDTPPPGPSGAMLYLSLADNGAYAVGSVANVADEDILSFDGASFARVFDGSDVGLNRVDLDAFAFLDANTVLLSFNKPIALPGLGVDDSDIVRFDATSLGENTAGSFSLFFDGSAAGLTTNGEDVDAVALLADGRLLISVTGSARVSGLRAADEDLLAFTPSTHGDYASGGSWSLYFDGSDVGLATNRGEDVTGTAVSTDGDIYLTTPGNFAVSGLSGADEDIFACAPTSLGSNTVCNFATALFFNGSAWGLAGKDLDAFDITAP